MRLERLLGLSELAPNLTGSYRTTRNVQVIKSTMYFNQMRSERDDKGFDYG